MVYYFTSNVVQPPAYVYVGKDKFESELFVYSGYQNENHLVLLRNLTPLSKDEDLIKYGWEEDIW